HSACVRWSFQRIAGRNTCPAPSRTTSPCIWPESPIGPSGSRERQLSAASHQSSGSCSAQPGRGVESAYDSSAVATSSPSVEIAIAFTPDVPTSSPISGSGTQSGVDELVGAHGVLLLLGLAQRRVVDPAGHLVDEPPLEHRALDRAHRILCVRV